MRCARAFGAALDLRDEPCDVALPDEIKPNPYYKEWLDNARATFSSLEKISVSEASSKACDEYHAELLEYNSACADKERIRNNYNYMLAESARWQPPSADHVNMKEFMISQLEDSITYDCTAEHLSLPARLSAEEWLNKNKMTALKDIEYHSTRLLEESTRAEKSMLWIKQLKGSL